MRTVFIVVIVVAVCAVALWLFYLHGAPVWKPVYVKFFGGKSVEDVISAIETDVIKRKPQLACLNDIQEYVLIAYKKEQRIDLYVKRESWEKMDSWNFSAFSGEIGPKLKEGDRQIPEGIYPLTGLNPNSSYHLSIKIGYPNSFDREMAENEDRTDIGCNIFIHGKAVTIGCIPLGDKGIEELFYFVYNVGLSRGKVIISPVEWDSFHGELKKDKQWVNRLYKEIQSAIAIVKKAD